MFEFLSIFTPIAYASVDVFVRKVNTYLVNPFIVFLITLAVVYFLYGVFQYLSNTDEADARAKGRDHMIWGSIGLFIMVSVFLLMRIILGTIGIDEDQINPQTGEINITVN